MNIQLWQHIKTGCLVYILDQPQTLTIKNSLVHEKQKVLMMSHCDTSEVSSLVLLPISNIFEYLILDPTPIMSVEFDLYGTPVFLKNGDKIIDITGCFSLPN